jgi:hypothetical protein
VGQAGVEFKGMVGRARCESDPVQDDPPSVLQGEEHAQGLLPQVIALA